MSSNYNKILVQCIIEKEVILNISFTKFLKFGRAFLGPNIYVSNSWSFSNKELFWKICLRSI